MARTRLVVLAAFALVFALAACGGGSSGKLTKEQYTAKLNELCLHAADQFREMHLSNTFDGWQQNAPKIVRYRVRFNKAVAALKPPRSVSTEDSAGFLVSNKNALEDDRYAIAAAQAGDRIGFLHALRAEHNDNRAAHRAAVAIGATGCYVP